MAAECAWLEPRPCQTRCLTLAGTPPALAPRAEERAAQQRAFDAVRTLLQARWPGARVHLFGSVANGLSVRHNNDIDVCLELEHIALDDQVGGWQGACGPLVMWSLAGARQGVCEG